MRFSPTAPANCCALYLSELKKANELRLASNNIYVTSKDEIVHQLCGFLNEEEAVWPEALPTGLPGQPAWRVCRPVPVSFHVPALHPAPVSPASALAAPEGFLCACTLLPPAFTGLLLLEHSPLLEAHPRPCLWLGLQELESRRCWDRAIQMIGGCGPSLMQGRRWAGQVAWGQLLCPDQCCLG